MCFIHFKIFWLIQISYYWFLHLKEYNFFINQMPILNRILNKYYSKKLNFAHYFFFKIHLLRYLNMLVNYLLNFVTLKIIIMILNQIYFYYLYLLQMQINHYLASSLNGRVLTFHEAPSLQNLKSCFQFVHQLRIQILPGPTLKMV